MPKNAVQRLQEIENDIKTVISLYEVANKSKNINNDKPETAKKQSTQQLPKIGAPKRLEIIPRFDKFREVPGQSQIPLFNTFKKASSFFAKPSSGHNPRESVEPKKWLLNKPGSAPSSSSTLSTICESDYIRQQPSDGETLEKGVLSKAKTADNLNSSQWLDPCIFQTYKVVMTPSKTLETAKEILEKNNFIENERPGEVEIQYTESVASPEENAPKKTGSAGKQAANHSLDVKSNQSKKGSTINVKNKKKEKLNASDTSGRSRSVSPAGELSVEQLVEWKSPTTLGSKSVVTAKAYNSKKSLLDITPGVKDGQKVARKVSSSIAKKSAKPSTSKHVYFKNDQGGDKQTKDANKSIEGKSKKSNSALLFEEKFMAGAKLEKGKSKNKTEKDVKVQLCHVDLDVWNSQPTENDESEVWVNELSKIIDKSNEKLEKMKVSKELALDIAKHFKEKYDKIQKSNDELLEKLEKAEKDNEKLSIEVNEERESKKNLSQKTDTKKEEKMKTKEASEVKEIKEEIAFLKTKLCETEMQYNMQLQEKTKRIEEIQMERLEENRNVLKNQDMLTRKLQLLTNEKCELLSKFDEVRQQLNSSKTRTQLLEENIRQLEEEVHKQKQHLKIKTETLHETNRELEMIRLNSTDLEEQVKMLRKSIEEFDGIQQSLIRKTTEYEQQIKIHQEKIKGLIDENLRLKEQLENEKDGLLIKVKIIEDQQQTIRHLKDKLEDAKNFLKRNQSLERILNIEREEKLELQDAVQRLKCRKEELKKKVKSLENDFLLAPQEVVRDLQKTQMVLHELENQVQMKQREWELQLHSLIKEKEQACSVAEFATKKLVETTSEFKKQTQAFKGLQRMVAGNMAAKERFLREYSKKILEKLNADF